MRSNTRGSVRARPIVPEVAKWKGVAPCTLLISYVHLFAIGTCAWIAVFFQDPWLPAAVMSCAPRSRQVMQGLAAVMAGGIVVTALVLQCYVGCRSLTPTERVYYAIYAGTIEVGILAFVPVLVCSGEACTPLAIIGVLLIVPSAILMKERTAVFGFLTLRFEHAQSNTDGAFIAELLEFRKTKAGDVWWLHHGREDLAFERFDHRRNWVKGRVLRVERDAFIVRVAGLTPRASTGVSVDPPSKDSRKVKSSQVQVETRVPLASHGMQATALLQLAQANLRCIDFQGLSLELMSGKVQGVGLAGPKSDQSGTSLVSTDLYKLSRPVKPGEAIDFFLSHSWHDNAAEKWEKLENVAATFFKLHDRYPTFWLDKVCIDQENIVDGLKVLPVNVMACKHMLVLCGPTYSERLWCAWELCTMLSFMSAGLEIASGTPETRTVFLVSGALAHTLVKSREIL